SALSGVLAQVIAKGADQGGATPRLLLQMLGTEFGRNLIHPDIWTNLWLRQVKRLLLRAHGKNVVCDDVRFPNEYDLIHQLGGVVAHIHRPDNALSVGCHESEQHTFTPDYIIYNAEGDFDSFYSSIEQMLVESSRLTQDAA